MQYNSRLVEIGQFPFADVNARKLELAAAGKTLYEFGIGDPLEPTPQFILDALRRGIPEVSQYPTPDGSLALREAMTGYLERRFSVTLDPKSQVIPTLGSKEAVYSISSIIGGPGTGKDVMVAPRPGYFVTERSAVMHGFNYVGVQLLPEQGYLMDLSQLPEETLQRTAIAWINYPHNPTGAACDLTYLAEQVAIAQKFDILLCSDETYADIYFGSPPPSILQVATEGVLAFHSCSKRSGMTGYRSGFVAGDADVISKFRMFRNTSGAAPAVFIQEAAQVAWSDDAHVELRREAFAAKRAVFIDFLEQSGFEIYPSDATFYLWVRAPGESSGLEHAKSLLEHGLVVSPGDFFQDSNSPYFRIALSPTLETCKASIELWQQLLGK